MMIELVVRCYVMGKQLLFEEVLAADDDHFDAAVMEHLERHREELLAIPRHMIEIEFRNHPDPSQRFFRFGTDPTGMTDPIKVIL